MSKICKYPQTTISQAHPTSYPMTFNIWGIDLIGPLPMSKEGAKCTMVVIKCFTKWMEEESLATITMKKIVTFIIRNMITRFGISHNIFSNNVT